MKGRGRELEGNAYGEYIPYTREMKWINVKEQLL